MLVVAVKDEEEKHAHQRHEPHRFGDMSFGTMCNLVGQNSSEQILIILDDREQPGVKKNVGGRKHKTVDLGQVDHEDVPIRALDPLLRI